MSDPSARTRASAPALARANNHILALEARLISNPHPSTAAALPAYHTPHALVTLNQDLKRQVASLQGLLEAQFAGAKDYNDLQRKYAELVAVHEKTVLENRYLKGVLGRGGKVELVGCFLQGDGDGEEQQGDRGDEDGEEAEQAEGEGEEGDETWLLRE